MRCETHETPSHDNGADRVTLTLHFDRDGLSLRETPFGLMVSVADLRSGGEPGSPALPRTQVRIAVPEPFWPHELEIREEAWETVVEKGAVVAPAQHLRAGVPRSTAKKTTSTTSASRRGKAPKEESPADERPAEEPCEPDHDGGHCAADCSCRTHRDRIRPPLTEGFPTPPFTPHDPDKYAAAATNPPPPARAVRLETIGTTRVAVVEVAPVRMTSTGGLQLCTSLSLSVRYDAAPPLGDRDRAVEELREQLGRDVDPERVQPLPDREITGAAEAIRLRDLARDSVLNADVVGPFGRQWPIIELPSEYLVVTDDVRWNAMTMTPTSAVPGMVAHFERLAAAKRARGVSGRVVTITDIVAGRYGDVRTGSRDLQEVIRRFLKIARRRWGVSWLLLGGDVSVVPVRQVAGAVQGRIDRDDTKSSPDDNRSYWTGSYLKMKVVNPGDWWAASSANQLVRSDTGALIPYDAAGTASSTSPGWFFTASDWTTRSTMPTEYVRVNGPAGLVNADLMFLYQWNTLPTDLYYASLAGWVIGYQTIDLGWFRFQLPYVYEPDHDWDANGNGIYGQHRADGTDLDGVHLATDLSVGRAPVESSSEAKAFVDKVLAYERASSLWSSTDREWPTRMVLASSSWGGPAWFSATADAVPGDGQYHHDPAAQRSVLKKSAPPESFAFELIAHVSDSDRRLMPYKSSTSSAVRGWYYAKSATDTSINELVINLLFVTIRIPMPSAWIVVHGPLAERTPVAYELDWVGQDGSMADQESLRTQLSAELPAINDVQRLYEDELDLTLAERFAAPVEYLTAARLQSALETRPHFVSLSGHGSSGGCCGGSVGLANALTNGEPGFIGYADSCLTNMIDDEDAFSEALVKNPHGGAVAYVGNTRFSWIGVGDNFQRAFFHRLTTTRHLGLLNDSRLGVYGTTGFWTGYDRWAIFALNLLGDPELQVYRSALPRLWLTLTDDLVVHVKALVPQPRPSEPFPEPPTVRGIRVHVVAGDQSFEAVTNDAGEVRVPADLAAAGPWEVTASHPDFVTAYAVLDVPPPAEGHRDCCCRDGCCAG